MKNLFLSLVTLSIFALAGCGGSGGDTAQEEAPAAEEQTIEEVGTTVKAATDTIKAQTDEAKKALDELDNL